MVGILHYSRRCTNCMKHLRKYVQYEVRGYILELCIRCAIKARNNLLMCKYNIYDIIRMVVNSNKIRTLILCLKRRRINVPRPIRYIIFNYFLQAKRQNTQYLPCDSCKKIKYVCEVGVVKWTMCLDCITWI